jgi:hypothetical protein
LPAGFDHSGAVGTCESCHNGTIATGKHGTHVATTEPCDRCHTNRGWIPAEFDHTGVTAACSTCHNGTTATGKHGAHVTTTAECDLCHTTSGWRPAGFDHSGVSGSCGTCHNGTTATGKPAGHFVTAQECDACHTTSGWPISRFVHHSAGYPGDHRVTYACTRCHGANSEAVSWSNAGYAPDCAGCHAGDYRSGPHRKSLSPATYYTVSELRDCAGSCHVYTDTSFTTISSTRNGKHRVSDGNFD